MFTQRKQKVLTYINMEHIFSILTTRKYGIISLSLQSSTGLQTARSLIIKGNFTVFLLICICKMDEYNNLTEIVETSNIVKNAEGAEADGVKLDTESLVSMNMWGLAPEFLKTLESGFQYFFEKVVPENLIKEEFLIPTFIGELLAEGRISVKVLRTNDTWYGMTYKEDVAAVKDSFREMLEKGIYREELFADL